MALPKKLVAVEIGDTQYLIVVEIRGGIYHNLIAAEIRGGASKEVCRSGNWEWRCRSEDNRWQNHNLIAAEIRGGASKKVRRSGNWEWRHRREENRWQSHRSENWKWPTNSWQRKLGVASL